MGMGPDFSQSDSSFNLNIGEVLQEEEIIQSWGPEKTLCVPDPFINPTALIPELPKVCSFRFPLSFVSYFIYILFQNYLHYNQEWFFFDNKQIPLIDFC